jgi:WD40 repeat protein
VWESESNRIQFLKTFKAHKYAVYKIIDATQNRMATYSLIERNIKIWSMIDYTLIITFDFEKKQLGTVLISIGYNFILGTSDTYLLVWHIEKRDTVRQGLLFKFQVNYRIHSVDVVHLGISYIACATDYDITVWFYGRPDLLVDNQRITLQKQNSILISIYNSRLIIGSSQGLIQILQMPREHGQFTHKADFEVNHDKRSKINSLAYDDHRDNESFAVSYADENGAVQLWTKVNYYTNNYTCTKLKGGIKNGKISFIPERRIMVTSSNGIRVWNINTSKIIFTDNTTYPTEPVYFTSNGYFVAGMFDRTMKIINLNNEAITFRVPSPKESLGNITHITVIYDVVLNV